MLMAALVVFFLLVMMMVMMASSMVLMVKLVQEVTPDRVGTAINKFLLELILH